MKIDALVDRLMILRTLYGNIEVEVNVPQLRPGDEGPAPIDSVELWENDMICLIEVK